MAIAVDIFLKDDRIVPQPVVGASVAIYSADGSMHVTTGVSDVYGKASFLLPGSVGGITYEVRFFAIGYGFKGVYRILVLEPGSNVFDISCQNLDAELSSDPLVCRCVGRFVGLDNRPRKGVTVRVMAQVESGFQIPKVVGGNMVSATFHEARTDVNGKVTLDLVRSGEFYLAFAGEEDNLWNISVPDRAGVNLIDLIHPYPASLSWDSTAAPGNSITLAVGETKTVPFSVLFSDFKTRSRDLTKWVIFSNSSDGVVGSVTTSLLGSDVIELTGISSGTAIISAQAIPGVLPLRSPTPILTAPVLTVSVTA